jgi:hypothetical protein
MLRTALSRHAAKKRFPPKLRPLKTRDGDPTPGNRDQRMAAGYEIKEEQEEAEVEVDEQKTLGYDGEDNEDGEEAEHEEEAVEEEEEDVQQEGEVDVDELDDLPAVLEDLSSGMMGSDLMLDLDGRNMFGNSLHIFMTKKQTEWDQRLESMRTDLAFLKDKQMLLDQVIL